MAEISLNERALQLSNRFLRQAFELNVAPSAIANASVVDAGVNAIGGHLAGLALARICLADLADVSIVCDDHGPAVQVITDHPIAACLASQYAGWQISVEKWFGMGSGPMRAKYGGEPLFGCIGLRNDCNSAIGVLEARKLPTSAVVEYIACKLQLPPNAITLWVAPTSSLAGMVQVVARSVEVALHKLHELKFDLGTIRSGIGIAPLPTATNDDLIALGRTNDAILYGGRVQLVVDADDEMLAEVGPQVPASASPSYGETFLTLFEQAGRDFYKMDPHLFAPAIITFQNRRSGRSHTFGRLAPDVLARSFGS